MCCGNYFVVKTLRSFSCITHTYITPQLTNAIIYHLQYIHSYVQHDCLLLVSWHRFSHSITTTPISAFQHTLSPAHTTHIYIRQGSNAPSRSDMILLLLLMGTSAAQHMRCARRTSLSFLLISRHKIHQNQGQCGTFRHH
jgi:hypothetical protein